MKTSLYDIFALMEGADDSDDKDKTGEGESEIKSEKEIEKEAKNADPDETEQDFNDADENLAKECGDIAVNAESMCVGIDTIGLSCCEAYLTGVSTKSEVYVTLEGVIGNAWEKIKSFFAKLWEKIKEWANKLLMYIRSYFMGGYNFLNKYKSQISDKYQTLDDREIKMDLYEENILTDFNVEQDKIRKAIEALYDKIDKNLTNSSKLADLVTVNNTKVKDSDQAQTAETFLKQMDTMVEKDRDSADDIKTDISDLEKEEYKKYNEDLTSSVAETWIDMALTEIPKLEKDQRKEVQKMEKNLNKLKKSVERISKRGNKKTNAFTTEERSSFRVVSKYTTIISSIVNSSTSLTRVSLKIHKMITSQAVSIARKVLSGSLKEGYYGDYSGYRSVRESSLLSSVMKFI